MATAKFDKRTLRERCTSHVRAQIINGSIKPGEHLVETRLSEEFEVSRGTLREALRPLHNEGLIVDDGRGHLLVRQITRGEIHEVFVVRAALESLATSLLCERDDREDAAAQLRDALVPLEKEDLSFEQRTSADLGFHELICSLTGKATLLRSWRNLIGQIEMMIVAAGPARAGSRMRYPEHVVIADAIAAGDVEKARAVVHGHMVDFASRYLGDSNDEAVAS